MLDSLIPKPKTAKADIPIPQTWETRLTNSGDSHNWVRRFGDPTLTALVNEALQNNHSLQAAALRIEQLKAAEIITKGRHKPDLSGSVATSNSGTLDNFQDTQSTPFNLSFGTSWEVDLWGRLKNQREQAELNTAAAKADYFAARLSLAGSTAGAYVNLLSAQHTETLAHETLASYEKSLRIIERNYKAGVPGVDALDVQFGRNNVTAAQRRISEAKLSLSRSSQALQILLGRYPEGQLRAGKQLPSPLSKLPNTLPAGVIEQRPDMIAARARLSNLVKEVEIRHKALLPSASLSGRVRGNSGVKLKLLLDPAYLGWTLASSLTQTVLDGGQRKTAIAQTQTQHKAAIQRYVGDALTAFREVEYALMAETALAEQTRLLREEVQVTTLAEKQATRDYSEGLENVRILSVIEAQRRAVNARSSLIRIRNQRLQNQIDLFVSMGGTP